MKRRGAPSSRDAAATHQLPEVGIWPYNRNMLSRPRQLSPACLSSSSPRTYLFAPASDEAKLRKALTGDSGAVIADLEDGVAPDAKPEARRILRVVADRHPYSKPLVVRVNGAHSGLLEEDLEVLAGLRIGGLMLPKATTESLQAVRGRSEPIYPLIETAAGLREAYAIACAQGVMRLMLGTVDLAADLGLTARSDGQELLLARSQLVLDSRAADILPPIDGVHVALTDLEGLRREARLAHDLGMGGKLCIHPRQVPIIEASFAPGGTEIRWARRVVAAHDVHTRSGEGAFELDGEMIDVAVVRRARLILGQGEQA